MTDRRHDTPMDPFANGGRDAFGRFTKGGPGGPGNPHAARVATLRSALMRAVTPEDVTEVIAAVVAEGKAGNIQAAKLVLDRCLGPIEATDVLARLEDLEALLAGLT